MNIFQRKQSSASSSQSVDKKTQVERSQEQNEVIKMKLLKAQKALEDSENDNQELSKKIKN